MRQLRIWLLLKSSSLGSRNSFVIQKSFPPSDMKITSLNRRCHGNMQLRLIMMDYPSTLNRSLLFSLACRASAEAVIRNAQMCIILGHCFGAMPKDGSIIMQIRLINKSSSLRKIVRTFLISLLAKINFNLFNSRRTKNRIFALLS